MEALDARRLDRALEQGSFVHWTDPDAGILMRQMPVRPAVRNEVGLHAIGAGLERVVCPKPTGQEAQPEFEVRDGSTPHRRDGLPGLLLVEKRQVEAKQRPSGRNRLGRAPLPAGSICQIIQRRWKVVLRAGTAPTKQQLAGLPGVRMTPESVMAAAKAEQRFVR
jgi:hypothetical protein